VTEQTSSTYRFGEKVVLKNVDFLRYELEPLCTAPDIHRIIFDLENCKVCDSYGVQFFLECRRKAELHNKELLLYRPGILLRAILKHSGISHVFTIVDTLESEE